MGANFDVAIATENHDMHQENIMQFLTKTAVFSTLLALAPAAAAQAITFKADLMSLNNSGVSGTAFLELLNDDMGKPSSLKVRIEATGLEPGQLHPQHIHGRFSDSGAAINSVVPPASADDDGDGFVEVLEGAPFYGPVILPLSSPPAESASEQVFPTAPDGTISFVETYDLSNDSLFFNPLTGTDFTSEALFPLPFREIVLHGATVPGGVSENLPNGGYLATLPVAAGEIEAVPEEIPEPPVTLGLLGLGGLALIRRRLRAA